MNFMMLNENSFFHLFLLWNRFFFAANFAQFRIYLTSRVSYLFLTDQIKYETCDARDLITPAVEIKFENFLSIKKCILAVIINTQVENNCYRWKFKSMLPIKKKSNMNSRIYVMLWNIMFIKIMSFLVQYYKTRISYVSN